MAVLAKEVVINKPIEMVDKHRAKAKIMEIRFVLSIGRFSIELPSLPKFVRGTYLS
jgi:hypothetical protein